MNIKFFFLSVFVFSFGLSSYSSANTSLEMFSAAKFLAGEGVIQEQDSDDEYNIQSSITRREMLKVMINISGKDVPEVCEGVFEDMSEDDWGCKYAEVALKNGYIAANSEFRPDDNVSKVEALKFIMQAKDIPRDTNDDWRAGYVSRALSEDILSDSFDDYDSASFRGWIFVTATNTYGDQSTSEPKDNTEPQTLEEDFLSPEDEELLEHFLNI